MTAADRGPASSTATWTSSPWRSRRGSPTRPAASRTWSAGDVEQRRGPGGPDPAGVPGPAQDRRPPPPRGRWPSTPTPAWSRSGTTSTAARCSVPYDQLVMATGRPPAPAGHPGDQRRVGARRPDPRRRPAADGADPAGRTPRTSSSSAAATSAWRWPSPSCGRGRRSPSSTGHAEIMGTLDPDMAALVRTAMVRTGIDVRCGCTGRRPSSPARCTSTSGDTLNADLVVLGLGVEPNSRTGGRGRRRDRGQGGDPGQRPPADQRRRHLVGRRLLRVVPPRLPPAGPHRPRDRRQPPGPGRRHQPGRRLRHVPRRGRHGGDQALCRPRSPARASTSARRPQPASSTSWARSRPRPGRATSRGQADRGEAAGRAGNGSRAGGPDRG